MNYAFLPFLTAAPIYHLSSRHVEFNAALWEFSDTIESGSNQTTTWIRSFTL